MCIYFHKYYDNHIYLKNNPPPEKKSMIDSVSKELCLGSLRNASVVYIIWLIFTADIKFLFSFPI
jgi:hypothetical protein